MAKSTTKVSNLKPAKSDKGEWKKVWGLPAEFPLFPLPACVEAGKPDGRRWAKKVRGKLRYFGKVIDDPKGQKAWDLWKDQACDLLAGREPSVNAEGITVADLCNRFLTSKDRQMESGELTKRTRADYQAACDRIVAQFIVMGMDLSGAGGYFGFTNKGWDEILCLAGRYDWRPTGTVADEEGWSGTYLSNDYQLVTEADAKQLADALVRALAHAEARERALSGNPKAGVPAPYRGAEGKIVVSANGMEDYDFGGPYEKAKLREFIAFCRAGEFYIG